MILQSELGTVTADHPLLRSLANWPGRGPTQRAFEAHRFGVHKAWQDRVIKFCGQEQSSLITRYWDEVASETIQCLGKGVPDQRKFVIPPNDRSAFLDELFAARDFLEPKYPSPSLIKCLFEYEKSILLDRQFAEAEIELFNSRNTEESARLGIETAGWSGKKRDVIPFVDRFCGPMSYERRRNRWRKKIDCGLVFEVGLDLGGNPYCIAVPLMFRIHHSDDTKLAFEINGDVVFQHLIPGSFLYRHGRAASDWVLGIKAYLELFDVIAGSFAQA